MRIAKGIGWRKKFCMGNRIGWRRGFFDSGVSPVGSKSSKILTGETPVLLSASNNLRRRPSHQDDDGQNNPIMRIAVRGDRVVIADHDEHDGKHDERVVLGTLFC